MIGNVFAGSFQSSNLSIINKSKFSGVLDILSHGCRKKLDSLTPYL
jgi:hypothetical protein